MSINLTASQLYFVNMLRSRLSMRQSVATGSVYKLVSTLGDDELWEDCRLGLNYFNTAPPILTTYRFKDLYNVNLQAQQQGLDLLAPENEDSMSIFMVSIILCAEFFAGIRLQWFEAGKHFQYNDNGISLIRDKQGKYQNVIGGNILQYISTILPQIRTTLAFERVNIKGQFSGMVAFPVSLSRALRGSRLGAL